MVVRVDPQPLTAAHFTQRLDELKSDSEREKYRRYFTFGPDEEFIGVRMGQVFAMAKEFINLPVVELELLLESPIHEIRAGACSVMGKSAGHATDGYSGTNTERRAELYELYLRRHDRINNWDLVDLAAANVVGNQLWAGSRDPLYQLAREDFWPQRRTAIVATTWFISRDDLDDTFKIAEMLLDDPHDLVHKGTGWMLRYAGSKDRARLIEFLDQHAARMPRVMLRYAIEHLDPDVRAHYRAVKT